VNGDVIEGYQIKNGMKQGDSLSCSLFILCMDPQIRSIEMNSNIDRIEDDGSLAPNLVTYSEDVTCLTMNAKSIQLIFNEYDHLSKASGLVLNANKIEILDRRRRIYKIKYMGEIHEIGGSEVVKINGVIFNADLREMREKNFQLKVEKITSMLAGWRARQLSLLGRILIHKTFGLSQVIYTLSKIELECRQYKKLDMIFNNFIWGRELESDSTKFRISRDRLCGLIEMGGFGMIIYGKIIEGIKCRQLCKLFDPGYYHPLKYLTIKEDSHFSTGNSLSRITNELAVGEHNLIWSNFLKSLKYLLNDQIVSDVILTNQPGEINVSTIIKPR
jgi:hypothetical protein